MKQFLLVGVVGALLTACGGMQFHHATKNQVAYQEDKTNCLVKANQAGYKGGDFGSNLARRSFLKSCMEGQGWVEGEVQSTARAEAPKPAPVAEANKSKSSAATYQSANQHERSDDLLQLN